MQLFTSFIVTLLSNNGMSFLLTSMVSNTLCTAITTGIVIRSMEWQTFPLPNLNVVSLRSRLILFNSSEIKDLK